MTNLNLDPWNSMRLIDVNGMEHEISTYHVSMILLGKALKHWLSILFKNLSKEVKTFERFKAFL